MGNTRNVFMVIVLIHVLLHCQETNEKPKFFHFSNPKEITNIQLKIKFINLGQTLVLDLSEGKVIEKSSNLNLTGDYLDIPFNTTIETVLTDTVHKYFNLRFGCMVTYRLSKTKDGMLNGCIKGQACKCEEWMARNTSFAEEGIHYFEVSYGTDRKKIDFVTTFRVASLPVTSVFISPKAVLNCPYEVMMGSSIKLTIENPTNDLKFQVKQSGSIIQENAIIGSTHEHNFPDEGEFLLDIMDTDQQIWSLQIKVKRVSIPTILNDQLNRATNKSMTLSLDRCLLYRPTTDIYWLINFQNKKIRYPGPSFTHNFESIGAKSVNANIKFFYSNGLFESIYIQLYDVVDGLNVTLNTTKVCDGDRVEVGLSLESGSASVFKYQVQSEGKTNIPSNPFVYTFNDEQKVDFNFYASNPISEDSFKVKLKPQKNEKQLVKVTFPIDLYGKINEKVTLHPNVLGFLCPYKYKWKDTKKDLSTGQILDVSTEVPTLVHRFEGEGTFPISLKILSLNDDVLVDAHTTVIIEREIDFELTPTNVVRVVGEKFTIEANFTSRSTKVSYRWLTYGFTTQLSKAWIEDVSIVQPWTMAFQKENDFVLSLEVKNLVSTMTRNASVKIIGPRLVTFSLLNDHRRCFSSQSVLDVEVKIEDNYNKLTESVICNSEGKNLTIDPKQTNPFKLQVQSKSPGIVIVFCALQSNKFNQSFIFYSVKNLDFSVQSSIMGGEDIVGEVVDPMTGIPYSWHLRMMADDQKNPQQWEQWESIANGSIVRYRIEEPGHFEVRVTVGNNAQSKLCSVTKKFITNIPLQVKINKEIVETNSRHSIKVNTDLNFSASVKIAITQPLLFQWDANITNFPFSENSGMYNYYTSSQGLVFVQVFVKINGVNASSVIILDIQFELTGVAISSQFGEHFNDTGNIIPAKQSSLDLVIEPIPRNAASVIASVSCLISRTNATIYQHNQTVKDPFRISLMSGQKPLTGQIECNILLRNSINQVPRSVTFFVKSNTSPQLKFVDVLEYTNDTPSVKVEISNNTLPARVLWYYGHVTLIECSSDLAVIPHQTLSCQVPLNDHADRLLVKLESVNSNGYESVFVLKSIRKITVSPTVIQVNLKTRITVDVNVSDVVFHMKYGSLESSLNYIDITESQLGNHLLNVTLMNRITRYNRVVNLTVIDAEDIGIELSSGKSVSSQIIKVSDGEELEFKITNQNQFVQYALFIDDIPVNPEPLGSYKYLFTVGNDTKTSFKNSTVSFRSKLNGVFVKSKNYQVLIFRPISNVQYELPTPFLALNAVYYFKINWFGEDGNCFILSFTESDCIGSSKRISFKVDQYLTYCTVSFQTAPEYKCYKLEAVISNIAGSFPTVWNYQPFEYIPLTIHSVNYIQRNQTYKASIDIPLPNTTYHWFLVLRSNPTLYNITLGTSPSISYEIPNDIGLGEYAIQVNSLYQGETTIFKIAMTDLLILPNTSNSLNSTLQVNTTSGKDFIAIQLEVKNYYPGLSYNWSVCIKSGFNNCTGTPFVIGHNHTLTYHLPKNSSEGIYLFTVVGIGQNMIEPIQEHILYSYCRPRNISISPVEISDKGTRSRSHLMSNWFYSEVKLTSKCPMDYQWMIFCTNGSSHFTNGSLQIYQPKLLEGMQFIDNRPLLELPPRAFKIGNYTMRARVIVGEFFPVILNLDVQLRVTFTPLVPTIVGGTFRVIGNQNQVHLDASGTIDPDAEYGTDSRHLVMKWDVPDEACYKNTRNSSVVSEWSADNRKLTIVKRCLRPSVDENDSYLHHVMVKRQGQTEVMKTSQKILVVDGVAPLAEINCVTCQAYKSFKYISTKEIKLAADCSNCIGKAIYTWSIHGKDGREVALNEATVKSPLSSNVLILRENVLDGKQSYEVKVEARMQGWDAVGSTMFTLEYNTGPVNGTCNFTPDTGEALTTTFTMFCQNWKDIDNKHQPLLYWVAVGENSDVFFRGIQTEVNMFLPAGDPLSIQVWVQDSLGVYTVALNKTIHVTPTDAAIADPVSFIQTSVIPNLRQLAREKNINQVSSLVLSASKILSTEKTSSKSKKETMDQLIDDTSSVDATSIVNIAQILNAFHSIQTASSSLTDIESRSRQTMHGSLRRLMSLSKSFAAQLISLETGTQDAFMDLISGNLAYDVIVNGEKATRRKRRDLTESSKDQSLSLMDDFYTLLLSTTIAGENARFLDGKYIKASLQRLSGGERVKGAREVGSCSVSYDLSRMGEFTEVSECSSLNPYSLVDGQSSITSLTLSDSKNNELKLQQIKVDIGIPVAVEVEGSITEEERNATYVIAFDEIFVSKIEGLSKPKDGWNSSAFHIVIDVEKGFQGSLYAQMAFDTMPPPSERPFLQRKFEETSEESQRTVILQASDYFEAMHQNQSYYFALDHDNESTNVTVNITIYTSTCRFWNETTGQWEGTGCRPSHKTSRQLVVCTCNHLTSFGSSIDIAPNKLDFTVLKKLDISSNPIMVVTCLVVFFVYLLLLLLAYCKDRNEAKNEHVIPFIGSEDGFFQYEVRVKTGMYPWAGTSAKVGLKILGTQCATKARILQGENCFQRNGLDIFRISLDRSIGKIRKIQIWHDNSGNNPTWYLERVIIRSMVNGEKFFFYCNKWIGVDCEEAKLEHEFHAADVEEMKKFSTIFYDILGRAFNDYHLWLSLTERPKFSKFTRSQRLTCLVTLVFSWMAVNAAWFRVAPEGKVDLYIGFKGYSYEEMIIGLITVIIVFPLNLLFFLLFRKSRQKEVVSKPLKIWKEPKRTMFEVVGVDSEPLLHDDGNDTSGFHFNHSTLKRTKKVRGFDNINFMFDPSEEACDDDDIKGSTQPKTSFPPIEFSEDIIHLPRSFGLPYRRRAAFEPSPLIVTPQHEYRSSSISYPSLNDFYSSSNVKKPTVKKTHSDGSFEDMLRDPQESPLQGSLTPEELQSHMTDILEQQLTSLVYEKKKTLPAATDVKTKFFSDNTEEDYYEARLSAQIKKNEQLMVHLQIPEVVEYDPEMRWTLPHWCTYVGYVCCFSISAFSAVVVITYGQQFGYDMSIKWLQSLLFGFLEDFFLTFPFVLIMIAGFMALFVKPYDLDKVDHYDFFICPSGQPQLTNKEKISPPSGYALETAITNGRKTKEAQKFGKEVLQLLLLLWLVVSIYFVFHVPSHQEFLFKQRETKLIVPKFESQSFNTDYFNWLEMTYAPYLFEKTTTTNTIWELKANSPLLQKRATQTRCAADEQLRKHTNITKCYSETSKGNWLWDSTSTIWGRYNGGVATDWPLSAIGYEESGKMAVRNTINSMKQNLWFDRFTRSIQNRFVMIDKTLGLYAFYQLDIHIPIAGYADVHSTINVYPMSITNTNLQYFGYFCMALLTLVLLVMAWKIMRRVTLRSFTELWFLQRVLFILLCLVSLTMQVYDIVVVGKYLNGGELHAGMMGEVPYGIRTDPSKQIFGVVMFLLLIRCVRFLSGSKLYTTIGKVLHKAKGSLLYAATFHLLVVVMFTNVGYLLFSSDVEDFRTYRDSFLSTFCFCWLKMTGRAIRDNTGPTGFRLGMLWIILYTAYWYILALNIFRAVLLKEWADRATSKMKTVWNFLWKVYFKPKNKRRRKRVHFTLSNNESPSHETNSCYVTNGNTKETVSESEAMIKETEKEAGRRDDKLSHLQQQQQQVKYDLPPLPYSNFEIESNLISLLADLDRMLTAENWEEESLSRIDKDLTELRQKTQHKNRRKLRAKYY